MPVVDGEIVQDRLEEGGNDNDRGGSGVFNNNNNGNLSSTSSQNQLLTLCNGYLQCIIIMTMYTNCQDTKDEYNFDM